jgi:hypothetical protein
MPSPQAFQSLDEASWRWRGHGRDRGDHWLQDIGTAVGVSYKNCYSPVFQFSSYASLYRLYNLEMAPSKSFLSLLAAAPLASAWGSLGHTAIAYMAQGLVSQKTAEFAQGLLNDTSSAYLANVATWADSYRYEKGGEYSAVYHYIDARE